MNSSQIQSSDSTSQDRLDFERFQGIWNNIKKAKQSSAQSNGGQRQSSSNKRSINSVKKAIQQQQQKNIETRLVLTQKQLKKAKQNTNLLLKKLSQAEEQIQYLQFELQKQAKQKQQILQKAQQLKRQYKKVSHQKTTQLEKSTFRQVQTQSQVQKLIQKLHLKQRQLDKLQLKLKSLEMTLLGYQKQFKLNNQNNKLIQKNIEQTQRSLLFNQEINSTMKGAQLLELEDAYITIQRLTLLLRNTEQFRSLGFAMEDFKASHFLQNIQQRMKRSDLIHKVPCLGRRICSCTDVKIDEKLLWTPTLCYKILLELKLKYGELNEKCIQEILFELNKIYASKQQASIKALKDLYQNRINELKKKNQIKYDELVARKQIQRLKKQVQAEKYAHNKSYQSRTQTIPSIDLFKSIGQYEDQLKLKEKQIHLLNQRIRLMESQNNTYDKILYLQGTLWVLDKVLLQIQASNENIQLFESKFRERINHQMSEQDWMNSFKHFLESITQIQVDLTEKLISMKQSTLGKMGNHREN